MNTLQQQFGFSFLEAIISIAVLIIGIVAVLQIFPIAFSVEQESKMETQAIFLAQEKIEALNQLAFESIVVGVETESVLESPFEKFSRETTVIFVNSELEESMQETDLKKIITNVNWKSLLKISELITAKYNKIPVMIITVIIAIYFIFFRSNFNFFI